MITAANNDTTVEHLSIEGDKISGDVIERVTTADVETVITGASTFTLGMNDKDGKILKSGLFASRVHTIIDGRSYEMVKLAKSGNTLTATFEDTIVAALRKHDSPLKVDKDTTTHVAFAKRLVGEVPGIKFISAPSGALATEVLHRGPINPKGNEKDKEDSWEAMGRIANARNWRRFVRDGAIWYVTDAYLFAQAATFSWKEYQDGVDYIDFSYDVGRPVGTATVTVRATRWALPPGITIQLNDLGPATGKYLVAGFKRSLMGINGTCSLTIPQPELPEPKSSDADLSIEDTFEPGLVTDGTDSGGGTGTTPSDRALITDAFGNIAGIKTWVWPTNGHRITGKYGTHRDKPKPHTHAGVDIGVHKGSPVYAAGKGVVTYVGYKGGATGNLIVIKHDGGLTSLYMHVYSFNCYQGQSVQAGDNIGKSGGHPGDPGAGDSQGDHLHFQMNLNGKPVDPAKYVGT